MTFFATADRQCERHTTWSIRKGKASPSTQHFSNNRKNCTMYTKKGKRFLCDASDRELFLVCAKHERNCFFFLFFFFFEAAPENLTFYNLGYNTNDATSCYHVNRDNGVACQTGARTNVFRTVTVAVMCWIHVRQRRPENYRLSFWEICHNFQIPIPLSEQGHTRSHK